MSEADQRVQSARRPRRLLVFAPSAGHEAHARQMGLLEGHGPALEDRDLLVESFLEDGPAVSAAERRGFGVRDGSFAVVLVGRDGGEKHRSAEPVDPRRLFDLVDAMPMRRREMREKDAG